MYDNSQLQQFKSCPESYRLKYLLELRKLEAAQEDHDRDYGSAIHAGLRAHYDRRSMDEVKGAFTKAYPLQLDVEDKAKTLENGLTLLEAYVERYRDEDKGFEVIQNEVTDQFEIAPGIMFTVKCDLVVRKQGCVYAMDHKTTKKSFGWDYWGQFEPNSQVTAQTAYVQAKFGECSGVIINGLSLGYRTRAYKGEAAGFHYDFQRQLFNRNKAQVEAWKEDSIIWINQIEQERHNKGVWRKNEGQCRFCSYKPICIACGDEQIMEQLYEKHDSRAYLKGE